METIERLAILRRDKSNSKAALEWLAKEPAFEAAHAQFQYEHTEGTGQWLLDRPETQSWLEDSNPGMLLVHGKPGCGKSVLAKWLTERLEADYGAPVVFCTFQPSPKPQLSNPCITLSTLLLHRVLRILDSAHDHRSDLYPVLGGLYDLSRAHPDGPQACPYKKLWALCPKALHLLRRDFKCFLIVDALETCSFGDTIPTAEEVVDSVRSLSKDTCLRVAIFSRPQPDLFQVIMPSLRISVEERLVANDIQRFSSSKLNALGLCARYKDEILHNIATRSEGCILWAKVYINYLSELCPDGSFLEKVNKSPPGLWAIYDQMIQHSACSSDHSQASLRDELFVLMSEARELFSVDQVSSMLSLGRFPDPTKIIASIGGPLLAITGDTVSFIHGSVKEYLADRHRRPQILSELVLFVRPEQSHSRLAEECLYCLNDEEYRHRGRIGRIMHRNFNLEVLTEEDFTPLLGGISYGYAWRHWDYHLTSIPDPEGRLLNLAQEFLHQHQFAYWSEYSIYRLGGSLSKIGVTALDLRKWHRKLPEGKKPLLKIDDYFDVPYRSLAKSFEEAEKEDHELPYLTLMRLGNYFILSGMGDKAIPIIDRAVTGLVDFLGSNHPLTLRSKTQRAILYLQKGRFIEANRDFTEVARIEEFELGMVDSTELYNTLLGRGGAELFQNLYGQSLATQEKAALGFLRLSGPDDAQYLSARLWSCYVLIEVGQLDLSLDILRDVFQKRRAQYSNDDVFAATAQQCIGDVQRKQGRLDESLANLRESLATRRAAGLEGIWVLDTAISLLVALRDAGELDDATALLDDLDREGVIDRYFDRHCQVEHLRALICYDVGKKREAINLLRELLFGVERDQYNRVLIWVILDLAVMLRARGEDGDKEEAEANFHNILVDLAGQSETGNSPMAEEPNGGGGSLAGGGGPDPDPPRLLFLAEKALTLVRIRKFGEVEALFAVEKVDWARPADLWLLYGAPAADTAWMKGPI